MTKIHVILAALIIAIAGGWFVMSNTDSDTVAGVSALGPNAVKAQSTDADIDISDVMDMRLGDPEAPVTVIEYASFTCPHCATFHQGPYRQLKADFIDTGKINFIYREVYFDRFGLWASLMARCAGPDKFFGITDLLYSSQSTWSRAGGGDPAMIADELRKIGRLAGMETDTINACLQDEDQIRKMVAWFQTKTGEHNISSTPSFVINGKTYSNMAYAEMVELINAAAE